MRKALKRTIAATSSVGAIALLLWVIAAVWPFGFPDAERYFDPVGERELQLDELGQINSVEETFYNLTLQGDDFKGWDAQHRPFWKYSIAFAAYGVPSLIIIDPQNTDRYKAMMDAMIWKMKSKRVWGDFTERGFGSDPITMQNIMYKGHLNLMYGLFQLATGDQRYAREYTWLTQQIANEMVLHHQGKYEGVTCEPGAWFVECNAIGMLSLHVYDRLYGTQYTKNEVQWSLDFILDRMRDPETQLFYRAYLPNHDLVKEQLSGYANAWILSFLKVFAKEEMDKSYPSFKKILVEQFGPYAAVLEHSQGEPDQVAQIFGLWAAKEHGDIELFTKLRNSTDKFGKLQRHSSSNGLAYDDPNSVLINGVILSSKVHLGWQTVLNHSWPIIKDGPLEVPNVVNMNWTQILPQRTYQTSSLDGDESLPIPSSRRACPACFWGDYQSVRMRNTNKPPRCEAVADNSCGVKQTTTQLLTN